MGASRALVPGCEVAGVFRRRQARVELSAAQRQLVANLHTFFAEAEAARAIEPLCQLWCIRGLLHNQWDHAFKLLKA